MPSAHTLTDTFYNTPTHPVKKKKHIRSHVCIHICKYYVHTKYTHVPMRII